MNTSPLLGLPQEILDQIYEYVFDLGAVHIHNFLGDSDKYRCGQLYHHSCSCSVVAPQDACDLSVVGSSFTAIDNYCCSSAPCKRYQSPSSYRSMDILLTCRRLNHEATRMLYANTMFRFGSWDVINTFISRTPSSSLLYVRSVHLRVRKDSSSHYVMWTPTLHKLSTTTKCLSQPYPELGHRTQRWQRGQFIPLSSLDVDGSSKGLMYLSDRQHTQVAALISDPVSEEKPTYPSQSGERENDTNMMADCL